MYVTKLFQNPFTFAPMQQYFNPKLYEALKEVMDNKALCNLTYYEGGNKKTLISIRIAVMGAGHLVTEGGEQIAVSDIIALNGKPAQFFV